MGDTEPHHRLDAVTVRIGIPPDEIAQAERVLGLDPQTARQTWLQLYETPADGRSRALASSGVSLGLCALDPGVRVAVRVHHPRRLPLDGKWAGFRSADGERLRVEEQRDGALRVLTATLSAPWPGRILPIEERVPLTDLLSVRQAAFLHDCQPARPPTGPLVRLGPIRVHRWPVRLGDAELAVVRWSSVDRAPVGFDAIELSHRMSPVAADFVQHALFATVRRAGLTPDLAVPWLENRAVYKMRV